MPSVQIHDETITGSQTEGFDLEFFSSRITARELIARRVEEEVRHYNLKQGEVFAGLVQPDDTEKLLNGYKMKSPRRIDAAAQVEKALQAFERNGFFLLVGDKQVENLDEEIELGLKTMVSFVKLVPLVGG
ncbi:MAG: hypothetical protein KY445_15765 [Armatimonadetes bacterium]|nr:hypothetical protein [Armatimonadota bacterium]